MSRSYLTTLIVVAGLAMSVCSSHTWAARVPVRGDFPAGAGDQPVPVGGGIPFPRGQLRSAENVRLLAAGGAELPAQITPTAYWPDGSIKWILIDAVLRPSQAELLELEYSPSTRRAPVADAIKAVVVDGRVQISGGGVVATIGRSGSVLDRCSLAGKVVVAEGKPARLVINTVRIPEGTSGDALPVNSYLCRDVNAISDVGRIQVDHLSIESPGPIRVTVLIRGHVLLPNFGATLPEQVRRREPPGKMPFSIRLSFYRNSPVIYGQHQIIYSGEPDCDYISRWAIELPGQAAEKGRLVLEPGVEMDNGGGRLTVAQKPARLVWAPIKDGFGLIRQGWQNRPCAITQEGGSAWIDFWPAAAGLWDLRRYARQWAVGENGDTTKPELMEFYAKYAARGIAKSHDFVIYAGPALAGGQAAAMVRSLSGKALLVAKPGWYGRTEALGPMAPEQRSGPYSALDARTRRRADYYLYCQDLYRWHGKLEYGYWQTRFGQVHRTDRWEKDYGRWGWSLNDGAGRIGHAMMIQFLRTLDRRYFEAGEAFNRINYDTNMVHTEQHVEIGHTWWQAKGNSHRHNVQPFGCPYIGMRGSYPGGQRILHLLTGDGIIKDGLEIVAETSFKAAEIRNSLLCHSSGSDGQGSASNALLWKYETTGDVKYLEACRKLLDRSGLIPPTKGKRLGYGPSFGLFNAAGEYADLSGDEAFQERVVQLGKMGAAGKNPTRFIYAIAMAVKFSQDKALRTKLAKALAGMATRRGSSLAELPVSRWPGHAGFRTAEFDANGLRDYPAAIAVLRKQKDTYGWPKPKARAKAVPASPPKAWFTPGGRQRSDEGVPTAESLLTLSAPSGQTAEMAVGGAMLKASENLLDSVQVNGASPLAGPIVPYVELARLKGDNTRMAGSFETHLGRVEQVGSLPDGSIMVAGKIGPGQFTARIRKASADGVPSVRVEIACKMPDKSGRVVSWGLIVPLKSGPDAHAIQTTAPGRFRLERCRLDQNDERIPKWLTSETHWGEEGAPLWPNWRLSGINIGPGRFYRIWRANAVDVSPVFCDQGEGDGNWLDLTDRGAANRWGLTVRVLRPTPAATDTSRQAIRANLETGLVHVQFHDPAAEPLNEAAATAGLAGAADLIFHDGWRPPLAKPELTANQYGKFLDDLDYGGNYGLFALRFRISTSHTVKGRGWAEKVSDLGIEPREILYSMLWKDGLAKHCKRIGVRWDAGDMEGSVRRVINHYRK